MKVSGAVGLIHFVCLNPGNEPDAETGIKPRREKKYT